MAKTENKPNEREDRLLSPKEYVPFESVLAHYGLLDEMRWKRQNELRGRCPFPDHPGDRSNSEAFGVRTDLNTYTCFSHCGKGSIIDFVAKMERIPFKHAVRWLVRFADGRGIVQKPAERKIPPKPIQEKPAKLAALPAMGSANDYLTKRSGHILPRTARYFGLGLGKYGTYEGKLIIPLHWDDGTLVSFAYRSTDPNDDMKYKFRKGTPRGGMVYNLHRQLPIQPLIVVEGFADVWKLHQIGFPNTVAICGSHATDIQITKICARSDAVIVMMDADAAGREAASNLASRLPISYAVVDLESGDPCDQPGEKLKLCVHTALEKLGRVP